MNAPTKQRILNVAKVTLVKDLQHLSTELQVSQHLIELYIKQLNSEGHNIKVVNGYVKYNPGLIEKVCEKVWN
jgi:biotin operon repressor